ncbi:MAG: 4-oxalocrotonate tautomerase family protein [Cypionkella sp.]
MFDKLAKITPISGDMETTVPYVKVEIAKGIASVEQKRAVIRGMTDVLVKELGRNPEYIFVVIDEIDTDNWGRKGQSLSELWQAGNADATNPPKETD